MTNPKDAIRKLESLGLELMDNKKFMAYEGPRAEFRVPMKTIIEHPSEACETVVGRLKKEKDIERIV